MRTSPWLVCVVLLGLATDTAAQAPPAVDQQLVFLQTAKVIATRPIGKGITGALRVTLSDGGLTHDAAFQSVDESPRIDGRRRAGEFVFVDHYRYNIAAYRLAVQLGLGAMMPATVEREIEGRRGALAWWIDDVAMDEGEREARGHSRMTRWPSPTSGSACSYSRSSYATPTATRATWSTRATGG